MKKDFKNSIIIGGGITGLAAGYVTGFPIFEAEDFPGGLCAGYYIKSGEKIHHLHSPLSGEVYRFERGGGHWIFAADDEALRFIRTFASIKSYARRSAVYFSKKKLLVPYPIQHNLKFLDKKTSDKVLKKIQNNSSKSTGSIGSMKEWLTKNFGLTLCKLFFYPFHTLYTAGLYERIAPQDQYKSPVNTHLEIRVGRRQTGYNATFIYPKKGLDILIQSLAEKCNILYKKSVVKIDINRKEILFADNSSIAHKYIISTIPLNKMAKMANLNLKSTPDPYISVLILNIGAVKGKDCPAEHWLYIPDSKSGFFRVGFYSNVDTSFLPRSSQSSGDKVSLYVERAFIGGQKPSGYEIEIYSDAVIKELQDWNFIKDVQVIDSNWIDVAYTWSWPDSRWREEALRLLQKNNIYQIGRYGRWKFQGIAESIKEGLLLKDRKYT